jgi:integrase/recombinase XerD
LKGEFFIKRNSIVDQAFEEFQIECRLNGLGEDSIKTYRNCWIRFVRDMKISTLEQINTLTVKQYRSSLVGQNLSRHTINNYLRHLRAIFNWMLDEEQELLPPVKVKMVKAQTEVKDVYTDSQLHSALKKPLKRDTFVTWRCWLSANVLAHTGMRGATMIRIQWQDIDLTLRTIKLHHTKTNARIIPIADELLKVLFIFRRNFNPKPTHYLVGSAEGKTIGIRTLQQTMKTYHKSRGIETNSLHQYRRTFITDALARNVDTVKVARMVGHTDLQMVNKHYLAHQVEFLRDVVK